jgi:hypothetical protein
MPFLLRCIRVPDSLIITQQVIGHAEEVGDVWHKLKRGLFLP